MQKRELKHLQNGQWGYIKKNYFLYIMVLLPVIYYLVFHYIPMAGNVIAFRKYVPGGSIFGQEWSGLRYFRMFINDTKFWSVFQNTLVLSLTNLMFTFLSPLSLP